MNTLETAIKFGVPTPETCNKLDWQGKTHFCWIGSYLCVDTKIVRETNVGTLINFKDYIYEYEEGKAYPAPQMHEIAPNCKHTSLSVAISNHGDAVLFRVLKDTLLSNFIEITDNHYAEAYAQIYIKLREAGLIEKEVQNG